MGPPGVGPTLPPNTGKNSILKIPISNSIVYVLELCIFPINFHLICACPGLPSTDVYLYLWGKRSRDCDKTVSLKSELFFLINFIMTFLTKEKDFNLLCLLSPGVRGARQEPPPRGDPGGSAFSAGLGGLLDGPMGPPGVSPTLPSNASRNSILKILVSTSIENVLELCMFNFYKVSPDFVPIWACISVTDHPATVVYSCLYKE